MEYRVKGGYLEFLHPTELRNIYIYLKFIWKSNMNHQELRIIKLQKKKNFDGVPLTHSHSMTPFDAPGKQAF